MIPLSEEDFEKLVEEGINAIPPSYQKRLENVAIVTLDLPTPAQRKKSHLKDGWTLYGLYEGIPQTKRGDFYSFVPPDKITIFREPILHDARDIDDARRIVRDTVFHEIAHHFGMDEYEVRMREKERGD